MSWMDLAECRGDDRNWFPDEDKAPRAIRELKAVCADCVVASACLEYALEWERGFDVKRIGVFGGLTPSERMQIAEAV